VDIEVLKSLLAVADTGSFSRAGTKLCVSQSAVSKRIRQLEESLNVSLLDRSGPVLLLTPAGKLVAKKAEVMLGAQHELLEELDLLQQRVPLSFCCTPSFGISYLPKVVSSFMSAYPEITKINFSYNSPDNILDGLNKGNYQVAVIEHCSTLEIPSKGLIALRGDEMLLIGSPSLGLSDNEVSLESVLQHTICTSIEACCCRGLLDQALTSLDKTVADFSKSLVYDDLNLIIKAVIDGSGIAYLSRGCVVDALANGSLVAFPVQGFDVKFRRSLVVADMHITSREVENLIKIVVEVTGVEAE
jgi:LysR family transcriptional regulator, transcriptional activator of the cysJI operon